MRKFLGSIRNWYKSHNVAADSVVLSALVAIAVVSGLVFASVRTSGIVKEFVKAHKAAQTAENSKKESPAVSMHGSGVSEYSGYDAHKALTRIFDMPTIMIMTAEAASQETFEEQLGNVQVGNVTSTSPLQVPFITWGGDMPTFYANGNSLTTQPGSIFHKLGLNIKLVNGDDPYQQTRDYMTGKSPFLRGTLTDMVGQASEVIASDPRTKGVAFLHMTWSTGGDNCVAGKNVKSINDIKIVYAQRGGPHPGLIDDALKSAKRDWSDIKVIWAKDLTGDNGPAAMFRKDPNRDDAVCFVITPDMIGLTGGRDMVGTGKETVKGAHVLHGASTAQLSRSIADFYICRKDFYDANEELVTKYVAGYLKAVEEVIDIKNKYEVGGSPEYTKLLQFAKDTFGEEACPTLDDAHGLLSDCTFVGYGGQIAFFREKGNLHGFEALNKKMMDLATKLGYVNTRCALIPADMDYDSPTFLSYLTKTGIQRKEKFRAEALQEEIEALSIGALDERTLLPPFTIEFDPNEDVFSEERYGAEFQRVVEQIDKYGNAAIAIRGHADPSLTLYNLVNAGKQKGIIQQRGTPGNYTYSLNGKSLDLTSTKEIIRMIEEGIFDGATGKDCNPREIAQAALNKSVERTESVRKAIIKYAESKGLHIDKSQIQTVGVGIREPFIAKPSGKPETLEKMKQFSPDSPEYKRLYQQLLEEAMDEAKQNMRVEFRLIKVSAEATQKSDFDF